MQGMIILDKPKGLTSNACLTMIKRKLGVDKIGHTGTLDGNATGVLVCLIGSSTSSQEYLVKTGDKVYEAELVLGVSTDTEDITGKVIEKINNITVDTNKLQKIMESFLGDYNQTPPMYSSKKIHGQTLLSMAKKGKVIDRKPCKVHISEIKFEKILDNVATFTVRCSKGTYIRTLCKDIGKKYGVPSCMGNLRRIETGGFNIKDAVKLENVSVNDIKPCVYKERESVVTFGKFETLHIGHQKLIKEVVSAEHAYGLQSTVLLIGGSNDNEILTKEQRRSKLDLLGVDCIIEFPLTENVKNMEAEDFIKEILVKQLKAKIIIVGTDARFGAGGKGNIDTLEAVCKPLGVKVVVIDKLKLEGTDKDISSTLIREEYKKGNIDFAESLL